MPDAATAETPRAAKPDHVPDNLVYEFDLFRDPALKANAHDRILELTREAPPVFWTPFNGGHWMLASHDAAFKGARDPETFTSEFIPLEKIKEIQASLPEGSPTIRVPIPINLDPPTHAIRAV